MEKHLSYHSVNINSLKMEIRNMNFRKIIVLKNGLVVDKIESAPISQGFDGGLDLSFRRFTIVLQRK